MLPSDARMVVALELVVLALRHLLLEHRRACHFVILLWLGLGRQHVDWRDHEVVRREAL